MDVLYAKEVYYRIISNATNLKGFFMSIKNNFKIHNKIFMVENYRVFNFAKNNTIKNA